nr:immunoglobulin light chain junction region [Macaca mulatta]
CRQESTWPTF